MSLGPTKNDTSNRLSQSLRTQIDETKRTEATKPAATTTAPAEVSADSVESQRVNASPEAQAGARAVNKGVEDLIRNRMQQTQEAPTSGGKDGPRRGLDLDGVQFVGKRSGKGRRTAELDTGAEKTSMMASLGKQHTVEGTARTNTEQGTPDLLQNIELAGKRSGSGTRIGTNDTPPLPGEPETGIA